MNIKGIELKFMEFDDHGNIKFQDVVQCLSLNLTIKLLLLDQKSLGKFLFDHLEFINENIYLDEEKLV